LSPSTSLVDILNIEVLQFFRIRVIAISFYSL